MGFSRRIEPLKALEGDELTRAMVAQGMAFANRAAKRPSPIEDVLHFAAIEGVVRKDYRVLSVLTRWIAVHGDRINADRLTRLVAGFATDEVLRAYWAAIGQSRAADRRFARIAGFRQPDDRVDLFGAGTDYQVERRGEHPWFEGTCLRVAKGTLRDRASDVLSAEALAHRHDVYRSRLIHGPSYRADIWAELERDSDLPAAELARRTYSSFAPAWEAKRDWQLVYGVTSAA